MVFAYSFQFLSFSSDILVKNLGENHFKYLSQEFDTEVLDLVQQNGFYSYKYMYDFETFNETLPRKKSFIVYQVRKELITKSINAFSKLRIILK